MKKAFGYTFDSSDCLICRSVLLSNVIAVATVKILKFGTPQTIAIIVLKIEKFAVTLH